MYLKVVLVVARTLGRIESVFVAQKETNSAQGNPLTVLVSNTGEKPAVYYVVVITDKRARTLAFNT